MLRAKGTSMTFILQILQCFNHLPEPFITARTERRHGLTKERVTLCTPFKGRQGFKDISTGSWSTLSEWVVTV